MTAEIRKGEMEMGGRNLSTDFQLPITHFCRPEGRLRG